MKRKLIILLLVSLLACGLIAWLADSKTPTIRFIEFREDQKVPSLNGTTRVGRVAVFRITNDSRHPYSFFCFVPSWPHYGCRTPDPSDKSGLPTMSPRKWGEATDTVAPYSTLDVQVHINASDVQVPGWFTPAERAERLTRADLEAQIPLKSQPPFEIGIQFERGTAAELVARDNSRRNASGIFYWLRCWLDLDSKKWEYIWSDVASPK